MKSKGWRKFGIVIAYLIQLGLLAMKTDDLVGLAALATAEAGGLGVIVYGYVKEYENGGKHE